MSPRTSPSSNPNAIRWFASVLSGFVRTSQPASPTARDLAAMVAADELAKWEAFGGKVEEAKGGRKVYVAPTGKKLRTWKEAVLRMERDTENTQGTVLTLNECHLLICS